MLLVDRVSAEQVGAVVVTPVLSGVALYAIGFALLVIAVIGFELILRRPGRRGDRGTANRAVRGDRQGEGAVPPGVDPVTRRRRPPRTQKLTGAVLLAAVVVLVLALRPLLGLR